ncbi:MULTISPECIES: IS21-like element helper ATPase IstB [Rossellomorea]|uniref:DNA replication protein DnaC n=1 Tax=Rossellomorea aquimaris TaxID=189382 RepID=A0A366EFX5_9BACI|nr:MULTISPECIES: IS21-like element helper ATPase IstB [Rossellomorea]MBH9968162.1 IS21-like element helper ATPase IstB [[Bacillus] enclensis]RBP01233.1 DNA replication protein DnaC [Rossellomorea aquimaris]
MNQETLRKLTEMKMGGMADIYQQQSQNREYQKMDFDDRFQLLVDHEYDRRRSNKLERLIKQATLNEPAAAIEDIEYNPDRKLNKQLILELAAGNYIQRHHNIILMGASGNGKTWIANAFGVQACRQFYNVKYIRLPELLDELTVAKFEADGSFRKLIQKYRKVDVLILDEWLLTELPEEHVMLILEIIESRLKRASTIFCSQFSPEGWHAKLGQAQVADAILDRIIHDSYHIMVDGEISMRERHGLVGSS